MKPWSALRFRLASRRTQHLVFLAHVWACAPFLVLWTMDTRVRTVIGAEAVGQLQPTIALTLLYLLGRTVIAWQSDETLAWEYWFPPIDVIIVSAFLYLSHRGPMSNISLLYFLPMVSAAGALNVRWAAAIGLFVVIGTAVSSMFVTDLSPPETYRTARELLQAEPLNAAFRLYFLVVLSSLMGFQALIAAGLKERLAVAADRNRISLDIHDGVQGHLIALSQQLELLSRVAERNPKRAAELARASRETSRQAADELRFLVHRLRAPALDDGFVSALRQHAHNVCARHRMALEFRVEGTEHNLAPESENALFRIAQEALNNVVKHAAATKIELCVTYDADSMQLEIADDGIGISADADTGIFAIGVGCEGMRERAAVIGGTVTLSQNVPHGTVVSARVPLRA